MSSAKFSSVADYLGAQSEAKATTIGALIDFVLAEFPGLESKLAWNVPTIHRAGSYVAGFAAYKNHITVSAWSPHIIEAFKPRLDGLVVFKNCFQIPVDWEIDRDLMRDLVRARLAELD